QVRMAIFEQDAEAGFDALFQYVTNDLHYDDMGKDIAVLSEEETAYGAFNPSKKSQVLFLYFPRGISQFRSEYSNEFPTSAAQNDTGTGAQQQQRNLRLDLEVTGSDDDSVSPYNKSQTPLSQEGVMLGILSELLLRAPKFILLRASDPLDLLFLVHYLQEKYP